MDRPKKQFDLLGPNERGNWRIKCRACNMKHGLGPFKSKAEALAAWDEHKASEKHTDRVRFKAMVNRVVDSLG